MTEGEKKMKRYVNAVERRLNLPKDVRARVMSDFGSSIAARREAGQTDDQIYEELGEPKKAAAELNEQMKEFAYRKSPWRFIFLGMAIVSGLWILLSKWTQYILSLFMYPVGKHASIGIIGGADGPTAIYVATSHVGFNWKAVVIPLVLVVGIAGFLRLRKCKKK